MKHFSFYSSILSLMLFSCNGINDMKNELLDNGSDSVAIAGDGKYFEGTITARQELMSSGIALSSDIEYMISGDKISRRIKEGGISKLAKGEAGTIIDIKEDSVIIFHGNSFDKFYCKISIDQYRKEMKEKIGTETVSPFKPYESIFLPLGTTHSKGKNIRDTVTIMKMKCDLLDIVKDDHHWEIQHCRELKVKRDMTELIFFNIPAQAEGFPCIYKYEILTRNSEAAKQEQNALDKLLDVVDKIVSAITECKVEIKKIEPGKPEFIEKEIMENYTRVSSLAELEAKFPEGGGGGFDD